MGEGEEAEVEAEGEEVEEVVVLDNRWVHKMVDKFELVGVVVVGSRLVHMMVGKLEPVGEVVRPLELGSSLDRM